MIILDRMLIGSIKFVLGKVAAAVDAEMNDDVKLREELLAAQMQVELGEISEQEYKDLEAAILPRLREIQEARKAEAAAMAEGSKVVGIEATMLGIEGDDGGDHGATRAAQPDAREEPKRARPRPRRR